jgi:hypothetical protein
MRVRSERRESRQRYAVSALVALACLAAISCKDDVRYDRAPRGRGIGPVQPAAQDPLKAGTPNDPGAVIEPPLVEDPKAPSPSEDVALQAEQAEPKAVRDFAAELAQMMGNPVDCLSARVAVDAPTQLDIALSTRVMPSGAVASSEVHAAGLAPNELSCLRSRVETLHFAVPIENAPFAVQGSLHLIRAAPAAAPAPVVPPDSLAQGATAATAPTGMDDSAGVPNPGEASAQP